MWNYILKATNSHVTFLAKYQPAKKTISPKWGCLRKYTPFYGHKGLHYWSSNNWKAIDGKQYGIRPLEYVNAVQTELPW